MIMMISNTVIWKKVVQPTLANIVGRKLVASGAHPGLASFRNQRNFPECIVKLYSWEARWKINTNSANKLQYLCFHQAHALPTMLISLPICFYAEFIIQIPGKCRLRNFYLVVLLKISTDKSYYFKIYFYVYLIETCLFTSWNRHSTRNTFFKIQWGLAVFEFTRNSRYFG